MTFSQLQYLLEVHKTGSFSQAAKNLFVSQPSISLTVKALEEELGYSIFLRTKKGLIPTLQGADVIAHAERICESYRLLTASEPKRTTFVRISAASVPPIQKAFVRLVGENRDRRDVSFSLTQERRCIQKIQNFSVEVGFYVVLDSRELHFYDLVQRRGLRPQTIASFPGVIRIGKGHPLFDKEQLSLEDFENDMFLDSTDGAVSEGLLEAGVARIKPNYCIVSSQHHVRRELVRQGYVYNITFAVPGGEEPDFRDIPIEGLSYKLVALTNPQWTQPPEIKRFMELVQEEIKAAGAELCVEMTEKQGR